MSHCLFSSRILFVMLLVLSLAARAEPHAHRYKELIPLVLTDYHYLEEVDLQSLPIYDLIRTSFADLGYKPQIRYLPGRRAFAQVLSGEADGALALGLRVKKNYPSLQLIKVPILNMAFYRYRQDSSAAPTPYCFARVGGFRGHEGLVDIADQERGCNVPTERVYVTRPKQLMAILKAGRVDYVVSPLLLDEVIHGHYEQLATHNLVRQEKPFLRIDLYMYLAQRNVHLVNKLEQRFRDYMKEHNYTLAIEDQFTISVQK